MSGYGPMIAAGMADFANQNLERMHALQDQQRQDHAAMLMNAAANGQIPLEQASSGIDAIYGPNHPQGNFLKGMLQKITGRGGQSTPSPFPTVPGAETSTTTQTPAMTLPSEQTEMGPTAPVTLPAGPPTTVNGPAPRAQNAKQYVSQILSTAKTPLQIQMERTAAGNQQALDFARDKMGWVNSLPPGEQETALRMMGVPFLPSDLRMRADYQDYVNANPDYKGTFEQWRALQGALGRGEGMPTSDMRARQDYQTYLNQNPNYKGTFEQWKAEQGALGRAPMASPGVQYMHALVKQNSGQTLTPEESAAIKSYPDYVRQTSTIPGVARAAAYASMRPMTVINPDNPEQTIVVQAGQAEKNGMATPQSINYQLNSAGRKAMIPRNLGQNLASLQTAEDHLGMLSDMVKSLGNGDVRLFNEGAQRWAQETGDAAPVDFDTLKTALEGEMARAYTGVGATNQEIANIATALDKANSPQQLYGALQTASAAMAVRKKNLWGQVQQATNGSLTSQGPAPRKSKSSPGQGKSKGKVSVKTAMALPQNQGKTKQQVIDDITAHGYEAIDDAR